MRRHFPALAIRPDFRSDDCATQTQPSPQGREEAGEARRAHQARARADRARLHEPVVPLPRHRDARLRKADDWEPLSSFFDFPDREPDYTERVKKRIADLSRRETRGNVVMVTHNVNIAALTRLSVPPAEMASCGRRVAAASERLDDCS
jgi:hypothetical protein